MSSVTNTTPALRITPGQAAQLLGINLGTLIQMRSKGSRLNDPTFPAMTNQSFDFAEVTAWQQAKTASATPATDATTTPGATQPGDSA